MEKLNVYINKAIVMLMEYGPKVLLALLVLVMGLSIIKSAVRVLNSIFSQRKVDPTLTPFLINLVNWGLRILLLISVASMIGVETTSFVAVLGAASLAVGLALQGSLANFAGGVLILVFRPFIKGVYIDAQGEEGTVEEIDIFATVITTLDNKKVIIPNGALAGGAIENYTANRNRRVDLAVGISYDDDIKKACEVLKTMCDKNPKVLKHPETFVGVTEYGDNSINLTIRPWCKVEDYWDVFFEINEQIKYCLDENNLSIPYPQRDLHIISSKLPNGSLTN